MRLDLANIDAHCGHVVLINNLIPDLHETFSSVFTALDFAVQTLNDLSVEEIRTTLNQCAEEGTKDFGCLIVIVLTHKIHGCKLKARDRTYKSNEILSPFLNCASLEGKPKIFFFVTLEENAISKTARTEELEAKKFQSLKLPKEQDFLLIQTSCQGLQARAKLESYVQLLCDQLMQWPGGNNDLLSLMTGVNQRLNSDGVVNCTPYVMSSLRHGLVISSTKFNEVSSQPLLELERLNLATTSYPGLVLLFNQFEFDDTSLPRREGSHCDVVKYSQTFANLGFKVKTFIDLTAEEITNNIRYYAESEDQSSYGCMMVVVMTYGEMGMLWSKDQSYDTSKIWEPLHHCESLADKPKIFLFQLDKIAKRCKETEQTRRLQVRGSKQNLELPREMNMLFIFHTNIIEDKMPMSSCLPQSKFTEVICTELNSWKNQQTDLLTLLTNINQDSNQSSPNLAFSTFISSLNKNIIFSVPPAERQLCLRMGRSRRIGDITPYSALDTTEPEILVVPLRDDEEEEEELIKPQMFGLTRNAKEIVKTEFKEIILKNNVTDFAKKLNQYQHNVRFLAKYLLQLIYNHDREELLSELLCHDLPQEELLYFLWRAVTDPDCSHEMFEQCCTYLSHLLQYHMDFSYRHSEEADTATGFPLLCLLKSSEDEVRTCEKLELLIRYGANVNSRYHMENEDTPIHFAVVNNMWSVVKFLLEQNANIDTKINGKFTRGLIASKRPELLVNVTYSVSPEQTLQDELFGALYAKEEEKFIKLIRKNNANYIDMNANDGKYTLLQLAIINKCSKIGKELIENNANLSIMGGYCTEPIFLVLKNPEFELLELFALNNTSINLKIYHNSSTFLHVLANESGKNTIQNFRKIDLLQILVEEALKQEIHINAIDKYNKTAFEICIETSGNNIISNILMDNGAFVTINEKIITKIEPEFLTNYLDTKVNTSTSHVQLDFNFMKALPSCYHTKNKLVIVPEMLPLLEISKSEKLHEVLLHPIITLFLCYKWKQIAFIYIVNFLLYIWYTTCFSIHIFDNLHHSHNTTDNSHNSNKITGYINFTVTVILWSVLVIREVFQIIISFTRYKNNPENYIEIFMLLTSFLTFIPTFSEIRFISACAIALTYIELTLLIGRHPYTETYITMFVRVSLKTIKLLFIFSSFIFAFAFGFYIFFYSLHNTDLFSDLWHSILRTSVMSAGEFSIDDIQFNLSPGLSELMFILFLIFVPIVLMNLLNALAISDTQQIIDETNILCCFANIKHYTKIESMLLGYSMENAHERCYGYVSDNRNIRLFSAVKKLTKLFGSRFRVNLFPIIGDGFILNIFLRDDVKTVNTKDFKSYVNKSCSGLWRYFYDSVLLRGNELSFAKDLAKKRSYEEKSRVILSSQKDKNSDVHEMKEMLQSICEELQVLKLQIIRLEKSAF